MTDYQSILQKLHANLNTLREREAKYAGNAPTDLLNQISDHEQAIAFTEQVIAGEITEAEWREALKPLAIDQPEPPTPAPEASAKYQIDADQIGVVGDHTTVEGGIHFNTAAPTFDQRGQQVSGDQYNAGRDININQTEEEPPFWKRLSRVQLVLGGLLLPVIAIVIAALAVPQFNSWIFAPQPTPLPFAPAEEGETLIMIATFEEVGDGQSLPHREIKNGIDQALVELNLDNPPRVEIHPAIISATNRDAAETLGHQYNASLIIWGTDTNVRITVNYLNLKDPETSASEVKLDETNRSQLADPQAYVQYITTDLPTKLTFLSLFAVARSFYLQDDYTAAIVSLERAVQAVPHEEILPGLPEAHFRLGWLYQISKDNPGKIIQCYDKAIELDPDYASPHNNRGVVYDGLEQYDQAIADYTKAIELNHDPLNWPYNNRGNSLRDKGEYEAAIADYDKAIELDPDYALAYDNRGITYGKLEQYDQAIVDFDKAIELDPDYASPRNNRGVAYDNLEQYDQAIVDFDKAIELDPDYTFAYNSRGNSLRDKGEYEAAIADYDKAIELDPDYVLAYNNRGITYGKLEQYDQAIVDFGKAIELDPDYTFAYNNRGNSLRNKGDYLAAIADFTKAIELDPEYSTAYYNRGLTYAKMGETEKAIADLEQGKQLAGDADYPDWVQEGLDELDLTLPHD